MRDIDLGSLGGIAVFSTAQAERHGISRRTLHDLVRRRRITKVLHGWYTAMAVPDDETRHRLAAIAAVQLYAGRGVASHHSALVLHGLPLHQVDLRRVYLERSDTAHGRARSGVVLRAGRSLRTTATMEGWATPVPTISVADACILSGAVHGAPSGLVAADAALRRGLCDADQLTRAVDRAKGYTGIEAIRAAVRFADGRHESPGETLTAIALRATGIPFEPQVDIWTRRGLTRVDFCNEELKLIVEFDGLEKYGVTRDAAAETDAAQDPAAVVVAEKLREDALRALGYRIVRIVWSDLFVEGRVQALIRQALAEDAA